MRNIRLLLLLLLLILVAFLLLSFRGTIIAIISPEHIKNTTLTVLKIFGTKQKDI